MILSKKPTQQEAAIYLDKYVLGEHFKYCVVRGVFVVPGDNYQHLDLLAVEQSLISILEDQNIPYTSSYLKGVMSILKAKRYAPNIY